MNTAQQGDGRPHTPRNITELERYPEYRKARRNDHIMDISIILPIHQKTGKESTRPECFIMEKTLAKTVLFNESTSHYQGIRNT